ncbi:probable RNA-binding protein 18 [Eriocheir sinensis]|uniref:probable RNA-binding protein 18 n=1 Tax=Eriocheir sinensis TaxID=95602 RepID=UPI0021C77D11|nr:probable RNA-binding protein 18 [Eriocheir sinensis]
MATPIDSMAAEGSEPIPPPPKNARADDRRLWVGNLDTRLREFQLLKMMEKFGTLVEFDFLYHRSGPQAGQPRGYAFVTFQSPQAARSAMRVLDGRIMLGRRMAVKWAHAQDESMYERTKEKPAPPILSAGKGETSKKSSKKSKIAELEAKLKLLDDEDNLTIDLTPDVGAERRPTSVTYAFIERRQGPKTPSQHSAPSSSRQNYHHLTGQPYSKTRPATGRKH